MEVATWVTAISTVIMAIATIVMAVAAWQAKKSYVNNKKCEILFEMYDELVKAKEFVWTYLSSNGSMDGVFVDNIRPILKNINVLKAKTWSFICDETKAEIEKLMFNYSGLHNFVAQGADRKLQWEFIEKIIKENSLDAACNAIIKEIKH